MRSNKRIRRARSRSNRTPAFEVISPPSKAANTTRLPKSEKRILKTPCFIKAHPNQHQYIDCKGESEYRQILVRNAGQADRLLCRLEFAAFS